MPRAKHRFGEAGSTDAEATRSSPRARIANTMSAYTKDNKVTHAGVAVNNWAGDFDCSVCKRKRLTASEFSKKMQEKKRSGQGDALNCKACVEAAAQKERDAAAAKAAKAADAGPGGAAAGEGGGATQVCSACKQSLPEFAFSKPQLKKGPAKQRCQPCIANADKLEAAAADEKKGKAIAEAKKAVKAAEATGSAAEKLKANSTLAALEGELVTGLKPMVIGRGRRGPGGRGRGRGRA